MLPIPDGFRRTMEELHGPDGAEWIARLLALLDACARRWSLEVAAPFAPLSYNYVTPAVWPDGTEVVLKVGFPCREIRTEIAALAAWEGRGSVHLLHADPAQGALLLERLRPGTPLLSVADDAAATSIAAGVMRRLWRSPSPDFPFPTVADWAGGLERLRSRFAGGTGPLPVALVETAEGLFAELLGSMAAPVLLHGDLHHENILSAQREPWLAIDPKGLVGEPAYEPGALLRNALPEHAGAGELTRLLTRRIHQLAEELELDRERIHGWALAQAVLSAWWSIEDHGHGWEPAVAYAEALAAARG